MPLPTKLGLLLHTAVNYLSMLSIRSKKIYVFGAWKGYTFSDNPKYLFLEANSHKGLMPVWITRSDAVYEMLRRKNLRVYKSGSLGGIWYQLRASAFFTCMSKDDVDLYLLGNATRINLWHGVGPKKILADDSINKSDTAAKPTFRQKAWKAIIMYPRRRAYLVTTSSTMRRIYSSAFQKPADDILVMGQPRNDVFFNDSFELDPFVYKQPGRGIILYMPTHRNGGKKRMDMSSLLNLEQLNQFCAENNLLFLIKKHFYHKGEKEHLEAYSHIKDITHEHFDAQVMLKHTNILITDYSSCYVDYLLLNRPVVFYTFDHQDYLSKDRGLYFDFEETTPGAKVTDFSALLQALKKIAARQEDGYDAQRAKVRDMYYDPANQQAVGEKLLLYIKDNIV